MWQIRCLLLRIKASAECSHTNRVIVSNIVDTDGKCGGIRKPTEKGQDDSLANDSNFGSAIDIAAPGVRINSTWNNGSYNILDGTSMAAPLVMGALAIYKIHQNNLSSHDLIAELLNDSTSSAILCNGDNRGTLMVIVMIPRNRCYSF